MSMASDVKSAVLLDFLGQYHEDRAAGQVRPLREYLDRFPGQEEGVAREYLALKDEGGKSSEVVGSGAGACSPEECAQGDVGPYRFLAPLGGGGQGSVFLAEDLRIRRLAAVKVLHATPSLGGSARRRFQLEADSIAGLDHPHICRLLDAELSGEVPYIAMHYVPGRSLAEHLAASKGKRLETPIEKEARFPIEPSCPLELETLLLYFERCARALHVAHCAGVVHRDIKPGNLLVTEGGGPLLLDFGLAIQDEPEGDDRITHSGDLFGTRAYLSPERIKGQWLRSDPRADVYSLGVTLFECLTGQQPFCGFTDGDLSSQILDAPVPVVGRLHPGLSADLGTVCERALEKDPEDRYPSAEALAEELQRLREGRPVLARPLPWWARTVRWMKRYPQVVGAACLFAIFGVGCLALLVMQSRELSRLQGENRTAGRRVAVEPILADLRSTEKTSSLQGVVSTTAGPLARSSEASPRRPGKLAPPIPFLTSGPARTGAIRNETQARTTR